MKKIEVLEAIKDKVNDKVLKIINDVLEKDFDYFIDNSNYLRIYTKLSDKMRDKYLEINCDDRNTIVWNKKVYSPTEEVRLNDKKGVALNVFTQTNSFVFDNSGRLLHKSLFSDNNEYYGVDRLPLSFDKESILEYFKETNPVFKNGYFVEYPKSTYKPFSNIWQRYGDTNVIREFGINPYVGEYSNISITFDDNEFDDIKLLSERNGQIFSKGREMKIEDINEIVKEIDRIYKEAYQTNQFDTEYFFDSFNETMFINGKTL